MNPKKSVFECWLEDEKMERLLEETQKVMNSPPDTLRCYNLCKTCRELTAGKGKTEIMEPARFFMV
ncbi:MAG: CRISPR-associated endonuclease Cas2 [Candidatus Omnitrophota bacterium]|jgi:CRISPR/Cas system-associated endoribonuclease Cas2|nr:MAG: CRISPR-associated endonuclease Cas2 [Candidatus Omnitrophota bacterium]